MKKQTAVEWLIEQLSFDNGLGLRLPSHNEMADLTKYFDQAKAMEKEQIEEAYDAGLFDGTMDDVNDRIHKQYYNETYGK